MDTPINKINNWLGATGQVQPGDLEAIAKVGFRSVINNRPDMEGGPEQPSSAAIGAAAEAAGLKYAYLPVVSSAINEGNVKDMSELLDSLPRPILAFCRSGARSTHLYNLAQPLLDNK
ncbi:MAG: TIGR01244 family sulfur transferase [Candidatus Protistobacter heckmanni]|nr:TIGR01244 family sulfur transferase [Candidatus Protistobacter heckmanni]